MQHCLYWVDLQAHLWWIVLIKVERPNPLGEVSLPGKGVLNCARVVHYTECKEAGK